MPSEYFVFVGFEISDEVKAHLEACAERDHIYLDDPEYLQQYKIDGRPFIGKRADNGLSIDRIDDIARSVVSLLTRVSPDWPMKAAQALVFPVEGSPGETAASGGEDNHEAFEYSNLVG